MAGGYAIPGLQPPDASLDEEERKRRKAEADAEFAAGQERMALGAKVLVPPLALAKPIGEMIEGEPAQAAQTPPGAPPAPGARPASPVAPANIPNTGASITQRGPGGTSLSLPLAAGSELDQRTSRGSTTRTQREVSKAEREAEADLTGVHFDQINEAEQKKRLLMDTARDEQTTKDALQSVALAKEADTNDRLQKYEAEVARRQGIADEAETDYKQRLTDWEQRDPKKAFWAKQDTKDKLTAGLSMLLGIFGGLKDGSNVGAERILKAIDQDTQRAKDVLEAKERALASAKGDVRTAKDDIGRQKDLIDLRSAVAKDRVLAEAESRAAKLGIPKAEIEGNEGMLKIRESAAQDRLKLEQSRAATVQKEQAWSNVTTNAGGGPAGADKPINKWTAEEKKSEGFATRMLDAHEQMRRFKYSPKDIAAIKSTAFKEQFLPKGMKAANDYLLGNLYENLSPEGKKRWNAEQQFVKSVLRDDSGAQISASETLSETDVIGERPGDTPETAAQKERERMLKVRGAGIQSGRPTYWDGVAQQQATAPAGPREGDRSKTPSGLPVIFRGGKWVHDSGN